MEVGSLTGVCSAVHDLWVCNLIAWLWECLQGGVLCAEVQRNLLFQGAAGTYATLPIQTVVDCVRGNMLLLVACALFPIYLLFVLMTGWSACRMLDCVTRLVLGGLICSHSSQQLHACMKVGRC